MISQAAYRDFWNMLNYIQQQTRTSTSQSSAAGKQAMTGSTIVARQKIQIATSSTSTIFPPVQGCNLNNKSTFNEADDGKWIGMGSLEWTDSAAFLDWAALRPMKELEFEKSCGGRIS